MHKTCMVFTFFSLLPPLSLASQPCDKKCTTAIFKKYAKRVKTKVGDKGPQGNPGLPTSGATCHKKYGRCRVFISATSVNGKMETSINPYHLHPEGSGLHIANQICQLEGDIRFGAGQIWQAWLSTTTTKAIDNIYYNMEKDFVDRSGTLMAHGPLLFTGELANPLGLSNRPIWTGTLHDGQTKSQDNCEEWSSASEQSHGLVGESDRISYNWTEKKSVSCSQFFRLYCFEAASR